MDARRLISSFRFAWNGVSDVWRNEQNFRLHVIVTLVMIVLAVIFDLSKNEWLILIIVIAGVLALELMNTAIERSVDLITSEQHPLAKRAKDASAAAVLIFAISAAIVGAIIFIPKLFGLFI